VTRIVAGRYGGRRIATPAGADTRPTADRVREALFSTVETLVDLSEARFVDLYAGSGAVGLEAASRGAASVLLVESDRDAARAARANIATLDAAPIVTLSTSRVAQALSAGPPDGRPYDVVFADPPYAVPDGEIEAVQLALVQRGWLTPGAVVVLERATRSPGPTWVPGITPLRSRRYGETTLWYGRHS
jgi:16S rRNA (guanine966-N2)-methyltransferase